MAYKKNYSRGGYGNNRGGNDRYNDRYDDRRNDRYDDRRGNDRPKKHSGCEYKSTTKSGNPCVTGWKFDKRNGMRSFLAVPYAGTKAVKSETGNEWHNWFVIISQEGVKDVKTSGLFDPVTKRVIIKELGYVMNPKGGRGGYVGTYINKG